MMKFATWATLAAFSLVPIAARVDASGVAHAEGPIKISAGKMVYSANGQRLAPVYRVNTDGTVQLIVEGRLLTLPAAILSDINGKLTASHSKADLLR